MTKETQILILQEAVFEMAKAMRQYPMPLGNKIIPDVTYIGLLAGGAKEDPEGQRFAAYFVKNAMNKILSIENDKNL